MAERLPERWGWRKDVKRALGDGGRWYPPGQGPGPYPPPPQRPPQPPSGGHGASIILGLCALVTLSIAWRLESDANTMTLWLGTDGGYGARALIAFVVAVGFAFGAWRTWPRRR